ncbi:hypothetical protein [Paenibacillus sp. JDR-2]|uniref:hypothetical protein n=1 Tax=Paenibacillus sp. (strain JDR-2) TaxID=324057 RepID=UPI000166A732|nr:hypothetical protein [Paenibacillus sp. JDR-2]ACT00240.1 hypothetical protein Pjdr2_1568 [Paenibacillus sp. JDR-2]
MTIKINGREIEKIEELERLEQHYFEVLKTTAYIILGCIAVVCLHGVIDALAGMGFDFGTDRLINAFKAFK